MLVVRTPLSEPLDQPIIDAFEESPEQSVRVRLQPSISRRLHGSSYRAWRNVHWLLDLETLEEAQAFREALTRFFDLLVRKGPIAVRELLDGELAAPN